MSPSIKRAPALLAAAVLTASAAFAVGSQTGGGSAVAGTSTTSSSTDRGDRACGPERGLAALAGTLGVSQARLRAALEELRDEQPRRERGKADLAARLASALGISGDKVSAALRDARPERGRHGRRGERHGPSGGDLASLAEAMGVSEDALERAFAKIHDEMQAEHDKRRAAFARALADKLGLEAAKVEDALGDAPLGRGGRHGGPPGPR